MEVLLEDEEDLLLELMEVLLEDEDCLLVE